MRQMWMVLLLGLTALYPTSLAAQERVTEVWRSPFGVPRAVSVNPNDGSVWAATGASVMHLASDGTVLTQINGLVKPVSVSVSPADGSCWVADGPGNQVVHYQADGSEMWRGWGYDYPISVSVNAADGSCWVADANHHQLVHLASDGAELWRGGSFYYPSSISVRATDGSCWVADGGWWDQPSLSYRDKAVVHLSANGTELWRGTQFNGPFFLQVNPADGTCWVADYTGTGDRTGVQLVHLSVIGAELWRSDFDYNGVLSVDPTDGSVWAGSSSSSVAHLAADGTELWQSGSQLRSRALAVNPTDSSVWFGGYAEGDRASIVHLQGDGTTLWQGGAFTAPTALSVNPSDHTCWVVDPDTNQAVHLRKDGAELWKSGGQYGTQALSVNATDGSCWIEGHYGDLELWAADGTVLWQEGILGFQVSAPYTVSTNASDGSCWEAIVGQPGYLGYVRHVSSSGQELLRLSVPFPYSLSVNPNDGSCWIVSGSGWTGTTTTAPAIIHVAANGQELWRGTAFSRPWSIAVDPSDDTCWIADEGLVHLEADGTEIWRGAPSAGISPEYLAVNPADGSVWVAEWGSGLGGGQVAHYKADGTLLWRGGSLFKLGGIAVDASDGSCWVSDNWNGQVVHLAISQEGAAPRTSYTQFEDSRSPWGAFAVGPGATHTWRQAMTGAVPPHSGLYGIRSEVAGVGVTGLQLELPPSPVESTTVVLKTWTYIPEWGDARLFFGFTFDTPYLDLMGEPNKEGIGWGVCSSGSSMQHLSGDSRGDVVGLSSGRWHLVEVQYRYADRILAIRVDGEMSSYLAVPSTGGRIPEYVVLSVCSTHAGIQSVYFDDVQVTLLGLQEPTAADHAWALLASPEQATTDQAQTFSLQYGNGYPLLEASALTETLPASMWVGMDLPADYTFLDAVPAPSRFVNGVPVWELPLPARGQAGLILVTVRTPTQVAEARVEDTWVWATQEAGAASSDPPALPREVLSPDGIWGLPQDVSPQQLNPAPTPDVWIRKEGPSFASPGDSITYALTVGNCGDVTIADLVVRDRLPALLGGGDRILANLSSLAPGELWHGVLSAEVPWGIPGGTLLLNRAYIPSGPVESEYGNNISEWETAIQTARDPNALSVSPLGGTDRGAQLTYTLECENVGAGRAYGVYALASLDPMLDVATVYVSDAAVVRVDPSRHVLVWEVGTLEAGERASVTFAVRVALTARRARPVIGQATVYFPSVPEETPTNVVANVVKGSFTDVTWDHWAVLPVEQTLEQDIVTGYKDGTYRPGERVKREQMAAYIARALAGGDALVPSGPATATFSDVATDSWAYNYIEYAVTQGVVTGYSDGTYRPSGYVNRGQMAGYVARALAGGEGGVPAGPATPTFLDVATDYGFYKHIEYIVSKGVVGGYSDGTYRPNLSVTRDYMAVYVARAFELPQ